jgi:hypothetical protein
MIARPAIAVWFIAPAIAACGSVLPPDEDAGPEPDRDASAADVASSDVSTDRCASPDCSDVRGPDVISVHDGANNDARADGPATDAGDAGCPTPVNCAAAACDARSCGIHGLVCQAGRCACPGGQTRETSCSDGLDNDCDGLVDCADPDCARLQCGSSGNQRCCGTTCVNTETDAANCQGCGLACAAGQTCMRITDANGTRGACTCARDTSQCPRNPNQVCRVDNNDGQDNLCACDALNTGNAGCAPGQTCIDVPAANFCRY